MLKTPSYSTKPAGYRGQSANAFPENVRGSCSYSGNVGELPPMFSNSLYPGPGERKAHYAFARTLPSNELLEVQGELMHQRLIALKSSPSQMSVYRRQERLRQSTTAANRPNSLKSGNNMSQAASAGYSNGSAVDDTGFSIASKLHLAWPNEQMRLEHYYNSPAAVAERRPLSDDDEHEEAILRSLSRPECFSTCHLLSVDRVSKKALKRSYPPRKRKMKTWYGETSDFGRRSVAYASMLRFLRSHEQGIAVCESDITIEIRRLAEKVIPRKFYISRSTGPEADLRPTSFVAGPTRLRYSVIVSPPRENENSTSSELSQEERAVQEVDDNEWSNSSWTDKALNNLREAMLSLNLVNSLPESPPASSPKSQLDAALGVAGRSQKNSPVRCTNRSSSPLRSAASMYH